MGWSSFLNKNNGIRWPLFLYLHQNLQPLITCLCPLDTTLRTLNICYNQFIALTARPYLWGMCFGSWGYTQEIMVSSHKCTQTIWCIFRISKIPHYLLSRFEPGTFRSWRIWHTHVPLCFPNNIIFSISLNLFYKHFDVNFLL